MVLAANIHTKRLVVNVVTLFRQFLDIQSLSFFGVWNRSESQDAGSVGQKLEVFQNGEAPLGDFDRPADCRVTGRDLLDRGRLLFLTQ
jgi:hypothetical protein